MVSLLDVNVTLALAWTPHVHHGAARSWFEESSAGGSSATPLTELGFVWRVNSERVHGTNRCEREHEEP